MLTHEQRLRAYTLTILGLVIVGGVAFNIAVLSRLSDIRLMNDVRSFSNALERYKLAYWSYPEGSFDLRDGAVLSENGFARGQVTYYSGAMRSGKKVLFEGNADGYRLTFTLRNTWPAQGITDRKCMMTTRAQLYCGEAQNGGP
ncbi:MAG: hypothetical protein A3B31_03825 [Candidatus Komeilibacteria bacterium RIFCSPLOWO2_01_FULL_53_11]|uniref:Type II secretion system protein GspG C-terminal domain-containing protein n=1 Tax=Candidatus Komeilibacteria bacterium RIFCSPLOWO2_01_FULL_53_11 TaxID=1798552 RepID=A0A1G2BTE7_9BACT|nr:MAG: hypothetical protein A3B31_03825 [Candidatus Komeilibacteria bacterium RIFCSPLOWO2_01_FULL_53_11]